MNQCAQFGLGGYVDEAIWRGEYDDRRYPKGCFILHGRNVNFNPDPYGSAQSEAQPVCIKQRDNSFFYFQNKIIISR